MRTFIAIELPPEIHSALAELQNELMGSRADVKWVKPENIHLTLKFLGEIDERQLTAVIRILEETAQSQPAFSVSLSSLGAFPKLEHPRVIWVGINRASEKIRKIAEMLEEKISLIGLTREERPFASHVTIGRVRSALHRGELVNQLKTARLKEGQEFLVTKLTLFQSILSAQGPAYTLLKEANLKAA